MRATLSSKHEQYPFTTDTVKAYTVKIEGDPHALAKGYDIANILTVELKVAKANYQNEEIQRIISWSREPYNSPAYYRDLALRLNVKEKYKKTIVFTHAKVKVNIHDNTREDHLTIILTASQKEDKMPGVCFGKDLEETYKKAEDRVNNPPLLNITIPAAAMAGYAKQEKREYAPTLTLCDIYICDEKGEESFNQNGYVYNNRTYSTNKTKLLETLNISWTDGTYSCSLKKSLKEKAADYLAVEGEKKVRKDAIGLGSLKDLGFGVEYDRSIKKVTIDKRNYRYYKMNYNDINLHFIKTTAWNIGFNTLHQDTSLYGSSEYGINGGFFNTNAKNQIYHISIKNGVPAVVGQQENYGGYNATGFKKDLNGNNTGGTLVFTGSKVYHIIVHHHTQIVDKIPQSSYVWAQGGFSLQLNNNNYERVKAEWAEQGATSLDAKGTHRTAMVAHSTSLETYLIVSESGCTAESFWQALKDYFGASVNSYVGIMLDGGGSTQLRCADNTGTIIQATTNTRPLAQIIKLESKGYAL